MRAVRIIKEGAEDLIIPINVFEKYERMGYKLAEGEFLEMKESIKKALKAEAPSKKVKKK